MDTTSWAHSTWADTPATRQPGPGGVRARPEYWPAVGSPSPDSLGLLQPGSKKDILKTLWSENGIDGLKQHVLGNLPPVDDLLEAQTMEDTR